MIEREHMNSNQTIKKLGACLRAETADIISEPVPERVRVLLDLLSKTDQKWKCKPEACIQPHRG
jgi:hypothetical protein